MNAYAAPQAPPESALSAEQRRWRYRIFAATWLSYVGFYFCRKPFSIVKADLGKSLGFGADALGYLGAAYLVAYTLGQFTSGALGPRFGPRKMLLAGMTLSALASLCFGLTAGFAVFLALQTVNGLAQATGWSNNLGVMAKWFRRSERGRVMGLWSTNFQVGGVVASWLASFALAQFGLGWAFFGGALALLAVVAFFWFNQANEPQDVGLPPIVRDETDGPADATAQGEPAEVRWSAQTWVSVLLIGVAYFGLKFIRYALWSWAPFVLTNNFGLKSDYAGYVSTAFDICGIAGVIATGFLSDLWFAGRRAQISFWMLLGLIGSTALLMTVGVHNVGAFAACIGLVGFTLFGPDALLTGAGAMDIGKGRGAVRAAGIIQGIGSAGAVVQDVLIGKSYAQTGGDLGPILGMLLGSAVVAALAVGAILLRNRAGHSDV